MTGNLTGLVPGARYTLTYTWRDENGEWQKKVETFTQPEEGEA